MAKTPLILSFFIGLLFLNVRFITSLVGFDCSSAYTNVTQVSLSTVGGCSMERKNVSQEEIFIKAYQLRSIDKILVYSCLIEADHQLSRCGKSIDTPEDKGKYAEVLSLNREDCMTAIEYHTIEGSRIGYPEKIEGLSNKLINFRFATTHGAIREGSCTPGAPLTIYGIYHDRPLRQTNLKIRVRQTEGILDIETGHLRLADGNYCSFLEGRCFTADLGQVYWKTFLENQICTSHKPVTLLYSGKSIKMIERTDGIETVFYSFEKGSTEFALAKKTESHYCGYIKTIQTEHPHIFLIEGTSSSSLENINITVNPSDVDITAYTNSKLLYVLRHIRGQQTDMYRTIQLDKCKMETKILQQLLTTAYISPTQFAYDYFRQPGYTSIIAGEVAYLIQCKAVSVSYLSSENICYQEIPVSYMNKTYFLQPRTKILSLMGTVKDCNPFFAPLYFLDEDWYTPSSGSLIASKPPYQMTPTLGTNWHFVMPKNLLESGLYTQESLDAYKKSLYIPDSDRTIIKNLARSSLVWNEEGSPVGSIAGSIDERTYQKLKEGLFLSWLPKCLGWIRDIGGFTAGLWFIWAVWKAIYGILVNFKTLKRINAPKKDYIYLPFGRVINAREQKHLHQQLKVNQLNTHLALQDIRTDFDNATIELEEIHHPNNTN